MKLERSCSGSNNRATRRDAHHFQTAVLAFGPPVNLFVISRDFQPFRPTLGGAGRRHTAQSAILERAAAIFRVNADGALSQPLQLPSRLQNLKLFELNRITLLLLLNERRNGLLVLRRLRDDQRGRRSNEWIR